MSKPTNIHTDNVVGLKTLSERLARIWDTLTPEEQETAFRECFKRAPEAKDINRLTSKPNQKLMELHKNRGGTLDKAEPVAGNPFHMDVQEDGE